MSATDLDKLDAPKAWDDFAEWMRMRGIDNDDRLAIADYLGERFVPGDPATIRDLGAAARERDELQAAAEALIRDHKLYGTWRHPRRFKALAAALHHKDDAQDREGLDVERLARAFRDENFIVEPYNGDTEDPDYILHSRKVFEALAARLAAPDYREGSEAADFETKGKA